MGLYAHVNYLFRIHGPPFDLQLAQTHRKLSNNMAHSAAAMEFPTRQLMVVGDVFIQVWPEGHIWAMPLTRYGHVTITG